MPIRIKSPAGGTFELPEGETTVPVPTLSTQVLLSNEQLEWALQELNLIPVPAKNDFLVGEDDETYINLNPEQVLALIGGASEAYVDDMLLALSWQEQVLAITDTPPGSPTEGDRHIVGTGTGAWENEDNNIATWSGSAWTFQTPQEGWAVWDVDDDALLNFNGSAWVKFGTTVTHNNLSGIQGGDTNERYHLTSAEHTSVLALHEVATSGDYNDLTNKPEFNCSAAESARILAYLNEVNILVGGSLTVDARKYSILTTKSGGTGLESDAVLTFTNLAGIPITVRYENVSDRTVTLRYNPGSGNVDKVIGGVGVGGEGNENVWQYYFNLDTGQWVAIEENWFPAIIS